MARTGATAVAGGYDFGVQAEVLHQKARLVDAVADTLFAARAAGAQVRIGRNAYGKLPPGQMIAALIDPIQGYGLQALTAAVDALHSTADALRAAGAGYLRTEASVQDAFTAGGYR